MKTIQSDRYENIDLIKGFAILLVIIGHLIQFNNINGGVKNEVFQMIYSFHMPLFFSLSGYIAAKTTSLSNWSDYFYFIIKKTKSLLIPLLTWEICVTRLLFSYKSNLFDVREILNIIIHPGLWFLQVIFVIFLFFGVIDLFTNKMGKKNQFLIYLALVVLSFLFNAILAFYFKIEFFRSFILFSIAFYLGNIVSRFESLEKFADLQWISFLSFITYISLISHWRYNGEMIDDILKIVISTTAFVLFLYMSKRIPLHNWILKIIILFGKSSLVIYILQFYITNFGLNFEWKFGNNNLVLFTILFTVSILISYICIFIARIFDYIPYVSKFLFGRTASTQNKVLIK